MRNKIKDKLIAGDRCKVFNKKGEFLIRYFAYEQSGMCYFSSNKTDAVTYRSSSIATTAAQCWSRYQKDS